MTDKVDSLTAEMELARAIPQEELAKKTPAEMLALFDIAYRFHSRNLWNQIKDCITATKSKPVLEDICPALMTSYVASQKTILERQKEILDDMNKEGARMTRLTKWIIGLTITMAAGAIAQIAIGIIQIYIAK